MTHVTTDYAYAPRHLASSQARWGAILAGIAVALALLCCLHLLGFALGLSIFDLSDGDALGGGLGIGAVIWSILSWCAALFLGAMLTARLSSEGNETVGLLNGVTLWATTSIIAMVLAFNSMTAFIGGTFSLASSAVSASASAARSTGQAIGSAASSVSVGDSAVTDEVMVFLKEEGAQAVASGGGAGGPSADEIRRSIDQLDAETVRAFAGHLIDGDIDAATGELAADIALSERDLRRLVQRVSTQVQQLLGTADNEQSLTEDVLNQTKSAIASGLAGLDSSGGTDVSARDVRAALDDLDREVMQTIAWRLVRGDLDGARNALVANTSLTRDEADALIAGFEADTNEVVTRYREQAEEYADTVGGYAQLVLWSAFFVSLLSLGASALGGWLGTQEVTRRDRRVSNTRAER